MALKVIHIMHCDHLTHRGGKGMYFMMGLYKGMCFVFFSPTAERLGFYILSKAMLAMTQQQSGFYFHFTHFLFFVYLHAFVELMCESITCSLQI